MKTLIFESNIWNKEDLFGRLTIDIEGYKRVAKRKYFPALFKLFLMIVTVSFGVLASAGGIVLASSL